MSGTHTDAGRKHPEVPAWALDDLREARELAEAVLAWDSQRRATASDVAGRPRPSFAEAVHAHDTDGTVYILPRPLGETRIASMVEAATVHLDPSEGELRTAVQAVTRAVADEAARFVAWCYPGEAVEVEYALWGTPTLRYGGTNQQQALLYEKGIPSDHLLEAALGSTPGGAIAAASIRAQRTPAVETTEPYRLEEEKTSGLPGRAPGAEPELPAADIAQIRALQAASFPTSPGTHQPPARAGAAAGTDPAATRAPNAAAGRGHGR
ncbi:hypothetical protein [Sinomonas atrocyanea]